MGLTPGAALCDSDGVTCEPGCAEAAVAAARKSPAACADVLGCVRRVWIRPRNNISGDLSPLRDLTSMIYLDISGNNLSGDLSPLRDLTSMTSLDISGNNLSGDLAALAPLTSLEYLNVGGAPVRRRERLRTRPRGLVGNLSFVQEMRGLRRLSIENEQLSGGLGPLQNLYRLEYFSAAHNDLSGELGSVPKELRELWLDGNKISGLGSGFSSSGVQVLSLRSNKVKANVMDIVRDLPRELLYLDMSENEDLRGDIGDLVSNVSSKTSIMDFFVKETNLTGRAELSDVNFFRNIAWNTEDMGVLEMNKSGSRNFELESKHFSLGGVTFESTKEPPRTIISENLPQRTIISEILPSSFLPSSFRDRPSIIHSPRLDPLQLVYLTSPRNLGCQEATTELDRKGGRNNTVRTIAGSEENRFVLDMAQRDDRYLLMCSISPPDFFSDSSWTDPARWSQQTSFPYAQAREADMAAVGVPWKQFISYNMTVQNSCGQSVCASYVQSVSQGMWEKTHPFRDGPIKEVPFDVKVWWTTTPSLRGWPEDVVNSLCIVDLKKVFEDCEEEGLRRFVDGTRPVQIVATGAFMAPDQGDDT